MSDTPPASAHPPATDETLRWRTLDRQHLWHPFTQHQLWNQLDLQQLPLVIVGGQGDLLFDSEGRTFIDGHSSIWCNLHGHRCPELDAALLEQSRRVAHCTMLGLTNPPAIELAAELVDLVAASGMAALSRVFYSDDGSTAVESACKMAFAYWRHKGTPRDLFISLRQAYHGDTLGAVSVGGIDLFHRSFGPLLFRTLAIPSPDPYHCQACTSNADPLAHGSADACQRPGGCLDALAQTLDTNRGRVAALIIEPLVQAAGGMLMSPPGYLRHVAELCQAHGVLLIADEVATGFGRTGRMFACEHEAVQPDLLCLSKSLTGGYLPLAVTMVREEIFRAFLGPVDSGRTLYHGHTFTGNPLACAVALASVRKLRRERIVERLSPRIEQLRDGLARLARLPCVGQVRQRGMIAGVELVRDRATRTPFAYGEQIGARVCARMLDDGVILRPLADTVVIFPPLCITPTHLAQILDSLERAIMSVLRSGSPMAPAPVGEVDGLE